MSDPPVDACSDCGAGPVEKLLFPVAVHFKGSGFYSTDYGRGGQKPKKDGGDGPGGDKASSDKADKSGGDKSTGDTKKPAADPG